MTVLLKLVLMLGMLVILPLGLRLIDGLPARLPRLWLAAATAGSVSLWLPRVCWAAVPAAGYAVAAGYLAELGLGRLASGWSRWTPTSRSQSLWSVWSPWSARQLAVLTALTAPAVAALALVAERAGVELFGFSLPVLALTVAHFHFAGFAAALIAALVCSSTGDTLPARVAAVCVPVGIGIVLLGFFAGEWIQLAGTVVLTIGLWLAGWVILRLGSGPLTKTLFTIAALVPAASMTLAVWWALGRATGLPHLSVNTMIATHGVANAVGFALCSILAFSRGRAVHSG